MLLEAVLAMGLLSLIFAIALSIASKRFAVKTDPRVNEVRKILPGANCGACGLAGCDEFALAVVAGKVPVDGCIPGQKEVADKISKILGKEITKEKEKKVAQLHCNGSKENCGVKYSYKGIETCKAASLIQGGYKNCSYACLGLGDCVAACPFDAITIQKNGLPKVDKEKCAGCGNCVKTCPKNLFKLVPKDKKIHVLCSSKDAAKDVVKACKVGCIACKACERACQADAIHVVDNLAVIDYSKCTLCGKCVEVCPSKIIVDEGKS